MQSIPKKINGFTILEVIIVLSLVGIISAIGIPKFNSWNKDRVVRAEAERVRDIVVSINSQVQRGLYGFGQFQVDVEGSNVSFSTNGMLMANIATRVFVGGDICLTGDTAEDYWDHFGADRENAEVRFYQTADIKVDVSNGVVCFSKDGSLFSGGIDFGDTTDVVETIFICSRDIDTCQNPEGDDEELEGTEAGGAQLDEEDDDDDDGGVIYVVSWSRFGNVKLEKWNSNSSQWIIQ